MDITKDWLEKYEKVKDILVSPIDFGELFDKKEIDGKELYLLNMGEVNFPTGSILVRDPLVYLKREEEAYMQKSSCRSISDRYSCGKDRRKSL